MPSTLFSRNNIIIIIASILFMLANMYFIYNENYYFNIVPLVILIIFLGIYRFDIVFFIIIFFTPLSIPLIEFMRESPVDFHIPTEPMLFGLLVIFIYKLIKERYFDINVIKHPVTFAIFFNLLWLFITAFTSTMPMVSFKFLLARIWFIVVFYLIATQIFKNLKNVRLFVWLYTIPLLVVIAYSIYRHTMFGLFDKQASHFVMNPFFRDHTSYGAIIAMMICAFAGINFRRNKFFIGRFFIWAILIVLFIALILSYTRAAWVSIICALGLMTMILLRIKFKYLALAGIVVLFYYSGQRIEIMHKLQKNKQDSSSNLTEHVKSISNITSDASNLERFNLWKSAFRMFKEKPVFGWGPGTYMFQYAPFQISQDRTVISTNFGDLGNAHSEYIGPLAESGILGSISFILIIIATIITGIRVFFNTHDPHLKYTSMGLLLGLITYFIHGTLNNFLDTDKASALFWGFTAALVVMDIQIKNHRYETPKHTLKTISQQNCGVRPSA